VLYQLRDHADRLLRIAEDADVQALALTTSPLGPPGAPDPLRLDVCHGQLDLASAEALARHGAGFEMLNVLNRSGCARARLLPAPSGYPPMNFGWRDYFRGAAVLGARAEHRVYVAQVFHSSVSDEIRFSLATPLFHDGVWVGVLAAGINVGTQWALPAINGVSTDDRLTVLIGPYDGTRAAVTEVTGLAASEYAILAHPALEAGAMKLVAPDCVQKINDAFGPSAPPGSQFELPSRPPIPILDYQDPFLAGHWLGASAPVGGTGYVVLVQTREDTALRTTAVLLNRLIRAFLVLGAVALLTFISFAVWAVRHDAARG
jgi:hypothetical protein